MKSTLRSRLIALATSVLLLASWPAHAVVDCKGTIQTLSMQLSASATVTLSLSGGPSWTYLCNTVEGTEINGVPASVCRTMFAALSAAKLANKQVMIRFNDYGSCTAVPPWANSGSLGWNMLYLD